MKKTKDLDRLNIEVPETDRQTAEKITENKNENAMAEMTENETEDKTGKKPRHPNGRDHRTIRM